MDGDLKLYSYWRSSAAYRVRIALNLKGLTYELIPVHLIEDGGQQHAPEYRQMNPQQLVPTLVDGERVMRQSLAIIEYLDETYVPEIPLLPISARERAHVRALAQLVACDIHPLGNLRVMQFLEREFSVPAVERERWSRHWMAEGFSALETLLGQSPSTGQCCEGDLPSLADICLIPQVYNARRFGVDLTAFPIIERIEQHCLSLPAFAAAQPHQQPDAPLQIQQ